MDQFSDDSAEMLRARSKQGRRSSDEAPRSRGSGQHAAGSARSRRDSERRTPYYLSEDEDSQDENDYTFRPQNVADSVEEMEEVHLVKRVGAGQRGKAWSSHQSHPTQPIVQPSSMGRSISIPIQGFKPKELSHAGSNGSSRESSARSQQQAIANAADVEAFLNRGQIAVKTRAERTRSTSASGGEADALAAATNRSASDWSKASKPAADAADRDESTAPAQSSWNAARPSCSRDRDRDADADADAPRHTRSTSRAPQQVQRQQQQQDVDGDASADFDHHDIYEEVDAVDMPQQRLRISDSPNKAAQRRKKPLQASKQRQNQQQQHEHEHEQQQQQQQSGSDGEDHLYEEECDDGIEEIDGAARVKRGRGAQRRKKNKSARDTPPAAPAQQPQQPPFAKLEAYAALRQQRDLNMPPMRKSGRYSDDSGGDFDGEERSRQQQQQQQQGGKKKRRSHRPPAPSGPPLNVRGNGWMGDEPQANSDGSPTTTTSTTTSPSLEQLHASAEAVANAAGSNAVLSSPSSRFSFVHIAHKRGQRTEHVQCTVVRERSKFSDKFAPTYSLVLEATQKTLLVAKKMSMNRTSNYHLFDMTRGLLSKKLSKKSGNYIGKLRAKNMNRTEYVLQNQNSEREELAGVRFDRMTMVNQLKEGNQPRKMLVIVPKLTNASAQPAGDSSASTGTGTSTGTSGDCMVPVPNKTNDGSVGSFAEKLRKYGLVQPRESSDFFVYESKDPVYENGNYRLNFNGRVSMPSVKNFQMVAKGDPSNIVCQFGKVEEDVFHLDFKMPINACQAFAFALCQFNL